ncbi:CENP-B homolog protein 2-like protein [Tanacetum coccineum]
MTDEIRRALCKHNKDNPSLTQKQLQEWVHSNYGLQVSQATISNTVKRSLEYLSLAPERGDVKRHKPAKFPDLEKSLYEWILLYQEHVNMTVGGLGGCMNQSGFGVLVVLGSEASCG